MTYNCHLFKAQKYDFIIVICLKPKSITLISLFVQSQKVWLYNCYLFKAQKYDFIIVICSKPKSMTSTLLFVQSPKAWLQHCYLFKAQKYDFNIVICTKPKSMTLISLFVQSRKWQRERDQSLCMSESRLRACCCCSCCCSSSIVDWFPNKGVGMYQYAFLVELAKGKFHQLHAIVNPERV